ncbi:50S ribosomal protein L5 [Mycoplasma haemocanis str. Illinois]|uniref:Large ribosomal subunit protein uL5 n=1 Tax=Mycoplasma haemocanis (strain Illinois) TaxID=1111676 RepID=H6N8F4_MYCHN|nr:50S ribosomal protein L5 [Mycoplasma haemocanis]AEW45926.1 50S ribosomal protein L5 [Mycoplasma haemocanis str. Illinois]
MNQLQKRFREEIIFNLKDKLDLSSVMQVPKLEKVVVNIGCGDASQDRRFLESSFSELQLITNQKPYITKAKKSVAEFKLRQGQPIGLKVTLRDARMWNFIEKLFNVALPRVRDFKGIKGNSFDGRGNLTIGIKEQIIFTEIVYDEIKKTRGMDITFVTSSDNDDHAYELLLALGCPLTKRNG